MGYIVGIDNVPSGTVLRKTIIASENIGKNRFVDYSNGESAVANNAQGVSVTAITSGNIGEIILLGVATIELGEQVYTGDPICVGADGKAVGQPSSDPVMGYALEDGDNGDFIEVFIK